MKILKKIGLSGSSFIAGMIFTLAIVIFLEYTFRPQDEIESIDFGE